jgi:hypothetical protein
VCGVAVLVMVRVRSQARVPVLSAGLPSTGSSLIARFPAIVRMVMDPRGKKRDDPAEAGPPPSLLLLGESLKASTRRSKGPE